jgi:hypothetical protein
MDDKKIDELTRKLVASLPPDTLKYLQSMKEVTIPAVDFDPPIKIDGPVDFTKLARIIITALIRAGWTITPPKNLS